MPIYYCENNTAKPTSAWGDLAWKGWTNNIYRTFNIGAATDCTTPTATTAGKIWYTWNQEAYEYRTVHEMTYMEYAARKVWTVWADDACGYRWEDIDKRIIENVQAAKPRELTEAEKAIVLQRQREAKEGQARAERKNRQDALKRGLKRARAARRAERLLRVLLTAEELCEWRMFQSVRFRGSQGGLYEVGAGDHGKMVYRIDDSGLPISRICYQPQSEFVTQDKVLALILDIKCDEGRILSQGNASEYFADNERIRIVKRRTFKVIEGRKPRINIVAGDVRVAHIAEHVDAINAVAGVA